MPNTSQGGDLDQQHFNRRWDADEVIATLETADDAAPGWRLTFVAGRRTTELAEDRKGLLTGWHDRTRAWHGDAAGHTTLLSLGICEQNGVFRGERQAFLELLSEVAAPLHAIYCTDEALVPCASVLLGQLARTDSDRAAMAAETAKELFSGPIAPTPADYMFVGAALGALARSPLTERADLLTRDGIAEAGLPDAVVLSLHSESSVVLRHKKLGYVANWHRFRVQAGGPAVREWLQTCFEPVRRTTDDIRRDLRDLVDAIAQRVGAKVLVINTMSTSSHEDITSYAPFPGRLGDTVATVRAKEMNLMLHDLAEERDVGIVDADAIAAELGGGAHLPDGIHQSRAMQQALRAEILHVLGYAARATVGDVPRVPAALSG
jgi:hypothetical protein